MDLAQLAPGACVILAIVLAYLNGLHDASNAVSTSIVTRTLSERAALGSAALLNVLGALVGIALIAWTLRATTALLGLVMDGEPSASTAGALRILIISAALATIAWEILTWWWAMPSSSWHAFSGGAAGAALVLGLAVPWGHELIDVVVPLLLSPLIGAVLTFVLVLLIARLTSRRRLRTRHLRAAQTVSAGAVAAGHGMHDVRLPAAIAALGIALGPGGSGGGRGLDGTPGLLPWWTALLIVLALGAGTLVGGQRLIRTLGRRITDLSTAQGLAAETSTALILGVTTLGIGAPVSTSHTVTAGIVGAGCAVGTRSVRWTTVVRIVATWIATPLAAALLAALLAAGARAL